MVGVLQALIAAPSNFTGRVLRSSRILHGCWSVEVDKQMTRSYPGIDQSPHTMRRNRKRGTRSVAVVDWANANDASIQKHVGYIDFASWIVRDISPTKEIFSKDTCGDERVADGAKPSDIPVSDVGLARDRARHVLITTKRASECNGSNADACDQGLGDKECANVRIEELDLHNIPESVLVYERQMKKYRAQGRVGRPVGIEHLKVVFIDEYIVVVDKPPGTLCVPGLKRNPFSIAQVVFDTFGCESGRVDKMIVHRLDMDTSGLVVFARTDAALKELHRMFRDFEVKKEYEALVCGSLVSDEGLIDLPLQRDHRFPPFMRVSTPESEKEAAQAVSDLQHAGWKKLIRKEPKPSQTRFKVVSRELYGGCDVTRVSLAPITGRTHQLRVHCAAIGHPIVADQSYGFLGEAAPNGGFEDAVVDEMWPSRATMKLQRDVDLAVRREKKELCLHAKELYIPHPLTRELMMFRTAPPF